MGGAEIAIREICKRMEGFNFDLITCHNDADIAENEIIDGVNVYRVGVGRRGWDKYLMPIVGFLKALELNKKNHYDLIWAVMANTAGLAALFFKLTHGRIPYLLTLQEGDPLEYYQRRTWFWLPLFKLIFKKANHIQIISRHFATWPKNYGYQGEVSVVPNGVDFNLFNQIIDERQLAIVRQNLSLTSDEKIVITTSRLVKKNGISDLIKAVGILKEENKFIKLLIIGQGEEEKSLQDLVNDLGLREDIFFLGHIKQEILPVYLKIADIFVRPSLSEGLGNSFLEAMAAGLPIVGTPVGGIPDFLIDKKTGIFCQPQNPASVAEAINLILSDDGLHLSLIEAGRNLVREKYNWDDIAKKMREIYENINSGGNISS